MTVRRRTFLKTAISGAAVTAISGSLSSCFSNTTQTKGSFNNFGIQLYSLKDVLPEDPKGVLKKLAGMGYTQIESFEGDKGMFWGMTNTEFKKYIDGIGLNMISSHCNYKENFERKAAEAAEIGLKYLIVPSVGPRKNIDDFKRIAEGFNEAGDICKKAGIRFAYHNHAYSFQPVEGQLPQEVMMQNTNPETVDFEMDIYWVDTAGANPVEWFEKYPNRFRLCHIKDRLKGAPQDGENYSCVVGTGEIDFPAILKVGKEKGLKYYIIEQENFDNITPIEAAAQNASYMKKGVI